MKDYEAIETQRNDLLDVLISGLYNNEKNRNFIMWNIIAKEAIEKATGKKWKEIKEII